MSPTNPRPLTRSDQAANRKTWVEALRSGKFQQTKSRLRKDAPDGTSSYCCLGVACELYRQATGHGQWSPWYYDSFENAVQAFTLSGRPIGDLVALPVEVVEWLGLHSAIGPFFGPKGSDTLTAANDRGASFAQIADIIESEPEGLVRA